MVSGQLPTSLTRTIFYTQSSMSYFKLYITKKPWFHFFFWDSTDQHPVSHKMLAHYLGITCSSITDMCLISRYMVSGQHFLMKFHLLYAYSVMH